MVTDGTIWTRSYRVIRGSRYVCRRQHGHLCLRQAVASQAVETRGIRRVEAIAFCSSECNRHGISCRRHTSCPPRSCGGTFRACHVSRVTGYTLPFPMCLVNGLVIARKACRKSAHVERQTAASQCTFRAHWHTHLVPNIDTCFDPC